MLQLIIVTTLLKYGNTLLVSCKINKKIIVLLLSKPFQCFSCENNPECKSGKFPGRSIMCPPSESAYCYVYQTDTAEFIKGCLDYDDPSNVMAAAWPRDQKCITILPSPDPAHPGNLIV